MSLLRLTASALMSLQKKQRLISMVMWSLQGPEPITSLGAFSLATWRDGEQGERLRIVGNLDLSSRF